MPRHIISTVMSALVIGAILATAQWYSPALLPWVLGFMLACIAANLRAAAPWIDDLQ
jgi:hypothetical protein